MSLIKLIDFFSTFSKVPVEVDDVLEKIVQEYQIFETIRINGSDLIEPGTLRGVHYRYIEPINGKKILVCQICYSNHDPLPWQRVACVKELIHILDAATARTTDWEAVDSLAEHLAPAGNGSGTPSLDVIKDNLAYYQAAAVLFPEEMREDLVQEYRAGGITLSDIAIRLALPEELIKPMLTQAWPEFLKRLKSC